MSKGAWAPFRPRPHEFPLARRTPIGLCLAIVAFASVGLTACEDTGKSTEGDTLTKQEQKLYDQQRDTCKTEAELNLPEFREQNGATDPERYAEYAANHGLFVAHGEGERQAAIDGCLAGVAAAKDSGGELPLCSDVAAGEAQLPDNNQCRED